MSAALCGGRRHGDGCRTQRRHSRNHDNHNASDNNNYNASDNNNYDDDDYYYYYYHYCYCDDNGREHAFADAKDDVQRLLWYETAAADARQPDRLGAADWRVDERRDEHR